MKIKAELKGRDFIEVELEGESISAGKVLGVQFKGCTQFMDLIQRMRKSFGADIKAWPLPEGVDHSSLVLREMILKLRGEWLLPDVPDEVCHCRSVSLEKIDQAIVAGAHSTDKVTRLTNASSNCGTCRPDVQKLIDFRLKTTAS